MPTTTAGPIRLARTAEIPEGAGREFKVGERYIAVRAYWIPGSYAPALSEKHNAFLSPLKNKGFKDESMTKGGSYAISTFTTLESNKSLQGN